jgi:hypothetical protein
VFANVPRKEWDKGQASANAWIKNDCTTKGLRTPAPSITDRKSLAAWLDSHDADVAVAIAARAALRMAPSLSSSIGQIASRDFEEGVKAIGSRGGSCRQAASVALSTAPDSPLHENDKEPYPNPRAPVSLQGSGSERSIGVHRGSRVG